MRHLGDITKIHGDKIPPVDVITGGSPCQDLSVAGKRAGLDGERSGLFMEQIRIVKEMRDATANVDIRLAKPRYMVWENVPGAFSSNKGKDFQAVLTEIIRIAQPNAPDVPMPKNAKWGGAGCLYDEMGRWSVAWRVHDAQFWGVPQRRKRIALVADFGGLSAPEILFVKKSLHWHSEPGEAQRQGTAERTRSCIDAAGRTYCLQGNGIDRADTAGCNGRGWREDVSYTLNTIDRPAVVCLNDQGGSQMEVSENISGTLRAQQHGHQPLVFEPRSQDGVPRVGNQNISPTLNTGGVGSDNHVSYNKTFTHNAYDMIIESETSSTLKANGENYGGGVGIICDSTVGALQARDCKGVGNQYVHEGKLIIDARQDRNT